MEDESWYKKNNSFFTKKILSRSLSCGYLFTLLYCMTTPFMILWKIRVKRWYNIELTLFTKLSYRTYQFTDKCSKVHTKQSKILKLQITYDAKVMAQMSTSVFFHSRSCGKKLLIPFDRKFSPLSTCILFAFIKHLYSKR